MRLITAAIIALLCFLPTLGFAAEAANHGTMGEAEQVDVLIQTLEDDQARADLLAKLKALQAVQDGGSVNEGQAEPSVRILAFLSHQLNRSAHYLATVGETLGEIPTALSWTGDQLSDAETRGQWGHGLLPLLLVFFLSFGAKFIAHFILDRPFDRLGEREVVAGLWSRLPFLAARIALVLLPVVAFVAVGYGVLLFLPQLTSMQISDNIQTVSLTFIYATVWVHLALATARLVLAPSAPGLRIFDIKDETANYCFIWARRLGYVMAYGFVLASAAQDLGGPVELYETLMILVAFLVLGMSVLLIFQNRAGVSKWIRGKPLPPEMVTRTDVMLKLIRRRLADVWHVLALIYISVSFIIWALNIEDGFQFILRATIGSFLILVIAQVVMIGISRAIETGFAIPDELRKEFPELEERANRYLPIVYRIMFALVWFVAGLGVLAAWGVDSFAWLQTTAGQKALSSGFSIAMILLGSVILWEIVQHFIERYLNATDDNGNEIQRSARARTLLPLFKNAFMIVLATVVSFMVLSEMGLDIAPLLAGAGVIGLAVGFGSQTLVKDLIGGLFILIEDTISVGDVVDVAGHVGVVETLSIRTIRLRDASGVVHTVPFSEVATVKNMTKDFSYAVFNIGVDYREDPDHVMKIIQSIGDEMYKDPEWAEVMLGTIEIQGVDGFADSAVMIKARIKTLPIKQWGVGREFNRRMKQRFDQEDIGIPFPCRTLYWHDAEGKEAEKLAKKKSLKKPSQKKTKKEKKAKELHGESVDMTAAE